MKLLVSAGALDAGAPKPRIATEYWPGLTAMYAETPPYPTSRRTVACSGSPNGYMYMSMAGALGDRWAIRTHPSCVAAVLADAAGDAAATKVAVPPTSTVMAASRARWRDSLIS